MNLAKFTTYLAYAGLVFIVLEILCGLAIEGGNLETDLHAGRLPHEQEDGYPQAKERGLE